MFKVAPEHLRHATLEERAVAQSDGREMLGIAQYVGERGQLKGSHYVDLSNQESPAGPSDIVGQPNLAEDGQMQVDRPAQPASSSDSAQPSQVLEVPDTGNESSQLPRVEPEQVMSNRSNPCPVIPNRPEGVPESYGPVRTRVRSKGSDEFVWRPPETIVSDFMEAQQEASSHKRQSSRSLSNEPPSKIGRHIEDQSDEALLVQEVEDSFDPEEVFAETELVGESVEVLLANFLQKKMQSELHHSNNAPELQEQIDSAKVTEWLTLQQEKQALVVIPPHEALKLRKHKSGRIMTSRFVITKKTEDGSTKIKARLCLRGHHDPDLLQKVAAGKCHSPTLAQISRNIMLQLIVSHQWVMMLGDIKGAFLEANVKEQMLANPVFAELPPGGVPGIDKGSLVQITGNIYGSSDAPHNWYQEFDKTAIEAGFTRSKFDHCLYFCHDEKGNLQGVLGAHVDDTMTGGAGAKYEAAIKYLRERFPFRKWREGQGEFLGTVYKQCSDTKVIKYEQTEYAKHIQPIRVSRERARTPWKLANPQESAALRAVNGALGWLSSQTRPDLAVQTSMSQQVFPNPTVQDLLHANQAVRRARQHAEMELTVPYIPPRELTVAFWSDAAFANHVDHKTQGGWFVSLTSDKIANGTDVPLSCIGWKSFIDCPE